MLASTLLSFVTFLVGASVASADDSDPSSVVCIAGQCVQGKTALTIGGTLSAPNAVAELLLLPGQYTESANPELLHDVLTASSASFSGTTGFANSSSISLPLSVELDPGIAFYSSANYSGDANFVALPTSANASNVTTALDATSFVLSSNTWAEVKTSSARLIFWDASPDVSQLPGSLEGLMLSQIQSGSCSTPCSSGGVCTSQGSCACFPGFTGSSCESCESGFFGSNCQACASDCAECDDGIGGTGVCLKTASDTQDCNCLNGVCQSDGSCTCNAGWVDSSNGTKCAQCEDGFFLSDDGSCKICEIGCTSCQASTGVCTACESGFTLSSTDSTECNAPTSSTTTGAVCPDGSFSNGTACAVCDSTCSTCTGSTANDCIICASGKYRFNSSCVATDTSGVCQTGLTVSNGFVADNNKKECEACPEKCTACGIPSFSIASTIDQVQCTSCLPGYVLDNGSCVETCPSGTFLDPSDNTTCTQCDSSCGSCAGSSTFCLTCVDNKLASDGQCVTTCPSNSFSSSGACVTCHPDCETCSGGSFNECSTCPSDRPVLSSGRCLPTCSKDQFYDTSSSTCQSCDSSCASCSGSGSSNCLSCSDGNEVLRSGSCVTATCMASTSVVSGLGACLSDLVSLNSSVSTNSSITGIDSPTTGSSGASLKWWEILLMTLGCAFIVLCLLLCWRRRARQKRAKKTKEFAQAKNLNNPLTFRERVMRFGERLFGHSLGKRVLGSRSDARKGPIALQEEDKDALEMRDVEEAKYRDRDAREEDISMDRLLDSYARSSAKHLYSHSHSRAPSMTTYDPRSSYFPPGYKPSPSRQQPSDNDRDRERSYREYRDGDAWTRSTRKSPRPSRSRSKREADVDLNTMSEESLYSYVTGQPRRTADARQPQRAPPLPTKDFTSLDLDARHLDRLQLHSRFSDYTASSHSHSSGSHSRNGSLSRPRHPTPAEEYASSVRSRDSSPSPYQSRSRNRSPLGPNRPQVDYGLVDVSTHSRGVSMERGGDGDYWLKPTSTGGTGGSGTKNPFRR